MTGRFAIAAVCIGWACACGSDGTNAGTRAGCAQGGALTDCPDAQRTSQGACWRLVDCGAIAIESDNQNRFTWGRCVDTLDSLTADRQHLVIGCIAASTCDELRVSGSPDSPDTHQMHCLQFGGL